VTESPNGDFRVAYPVLFLFGVARTLSPFEQLSGLSLPVLATIFLEGSIGFYLKYRRASVEWLLIGTGE